MCILEIWFVLYDWLDLMKVRASGGPLTHCHGVCCFETCVNARFIISFLISLSLYNLSNLIHVLFHWLVVMQCTPRFRWVMVRNPSYSTLRFRWVMVRNPSYSAIPLSDGPGLYPPYFIEFSLRWLQRCRLWMNYVALLLLSLCVCEYGCEMLWLFGMNFWMFGWLPRCFQKFGIDFLWKIYIQGL